jgi:hypothetical protein
MFVCVCVCVCVCVELEMAVGMFNLDLLRASPEIKSKIAVEKYKSLL